LFRSLAALPADNLMKNTFIHTSIFAICLFHPILLTRILLNCKKIDLDVIFFSKKSLGQFCQLPISQIGIQKTNNFPGMPT
jgi:hypothetical protein